MKNKHCFYTSFNKAYAAQALLLAESLRRVYDDKAYVIALVVDELSDAERDQLAAFDEILLASELDIPDFRNWMFGHTIVEAATAVKPFALLHLLERFGRVTYLDPDIYVYSALDEVTGTANRSDVTLTPHQTTPQGVEWLAQATEMESMRFGVYNLGFLSVRATGEGKRVAQWWADRCYRHCTEDSDRGLFTDQKFFDLAPALFDGVKILRHPGYNVATWNLRERDVTLGDQGPLVNGLPLRFCHYTKATHLGGVALERMATGGNLFVELFHAYVARLRRNQSHLSQFDRNWAYGAFLDGTPISPDIRKAFRKQPALALPGIRDPFADKAILHHLLAEPAA